MSFPFTLNDFSIFCKADVLATNSHSLEVSLLHLYFQIILLLDINFLVNRDPSPPALWVCHPTFFWILLFLMWNKLLILLCFLCIMHYFSLAAFRIFSGSVFQKFYYDDYGCLCVPPTWTLFEYVNYCFSLNLRTLEPYFLKYLFCFFLPLLFFWSSH